MAIKESCSDAIRKWLVDHEWHFDERKRDDGCIVFKTSVAAANIFKGYDVSVLCHEEDVQSLFYPPFKAPPKHYASVAEYLMRVNGRFRFGRWTLDYEDGEVCFEVIKDRERVESDPADAMSELIGFAEYVCDGFAEGIMQVITGAKTPEEAYTEADARDNIPEPDDEPDDDDSDDQFSGADAGDEAGAMSDGEKIRELVRLDMEENLSKEKGKNRSVQKPIPANALPKGYSIEGLTVEGDVSLVEILGAIRRFRMERCADIDAPRLNILLSGVPGSGKTAFARYIANEVGAELMTLKASDVLRPHVGETEALIDKAFSDAKKHGAILFLDEIDSVLVNRRHAEHSWEVAQTSQLLQSMEAFEGIVIAATNLVENLDEAVMRRFTYKLRLSYLTDEGKQIFFSRYFGTPLTDAQLKKLNSIDRLTPGDFRTVKEGLYYLADKQNNEARLDALAAEAAAKGQGRNRIGF